MMFLWIQMYKQIRYYVLSESERKFLQIGGCRYVDNKLRHWKLTMQEYSCYYLYGRGVIITATMAARCTKNGPLPSNNSRSDDTTSGTNGSTESKMHQSYNWWGSNPPLLVVEGRSPPATTCVT